VYRSPHQRQPAQPDPDRVARPENAAISTQLLDIPEAGSRLGVSRSTVFNLLREGVLPACKLGRRTLIRANDIDALVQRLARATYRPPAK
jgi:excisionase family DNA binding protein